MKNQKEKRHTSLKVLLAGLFVLVLTLGLGVGAEAKAATSESSDKVTKKEVKAFAKKVQKANTVKKILKKHGSFSDKATSYELYASNDCAYFAVVGDNENMVYADKNLACQLSDYDKPEFSYLFNIAGKGDMYNTTFTYKCMDDEFEAKGLCEDTPISLVDNGETITFVSKLNKKNLKKLVESLKIEGEVSAAYHKVVVDAKTYEALEWSTYTEGNEDNPEFFASRYYGVPQPRDCSLIRMMAYRISREFMVVTVVRDAGTPNEFSMEIGMPKGSTVRVVMDGLDGKFYEDPECTKISTDWDYLSDVTLYFKSADADGTAE